MMARAHDGRGPDEDPNQWSEAAPLPRWALWLMLPGIVGPLLIFVFILRTESAHRDCPYSELSRRELAPGVVVVEERRSCMADVEERRYTLFRQRKPQRLGERRFASEAFAPTHYSWTVQTSAEGEVQVQVHNQGHPDAHFREGTPKEHAEGIAL